MVKFFCNARKVLWLAALLFAANANAQMVANGDPAIIGAHGLTSLVANDVSTGTTVNLLGKTSATGALKATTSDTSIPTFLVVGQAGTSGSAQFLIAGQGACVMDATNGSGASGWYVIESVTTNGRCHAQSSAPTGWIVGRLVDDATTSGSTANILASGTFNISGAGSGTVTSIATTSPIGGGTITSSGTITCTTCVTSAAALTDKAIIIGSGGGQGTQTVAGLTTDAISKITLGVAGTSVGDVDFKNATSGTISLQPVTGALGSVTLSLPAATDTLIGKATTDTLTNKTYDTAGSGNVFKINGTTISATTGSGSAVLATSPTLTTPVISTITNTGTVTLFTATDTVVGKATTDTLTNKTLDAEGTGNVITIPVKVWLPAAGCTNATAASFWDLPTSTPAVAACVTGTNIQKGVLQYADTSGGFSAQNTVLLPADFSGNLDARIIWRTAATSGNAKFSFSTICTDVAATATDDPAFNTASTVTTAAPGTTLRLQTSSIASVTITGCSAGNLLHVKLFRDGNDGSDTLSSSLDVIGVELTIRRAM